MWILILCILHCFITLVDGRFIHQFLSGIRVQSRERLEKKQTFVKVVKFGIKMS